MRVLVTGGAGFIGRHLVAALVADEAQGTEVVVLDNLHRGERAALAPFERSGALRFVAGDVRERAALDAVMAGVEVVYHLAAPLTTVLYQGLRRVSYLVL